MTYQWHDLRVSIEMIIMGGLFVMGIYNIVLFSLLRKGFSYFCFGLLCFFICLRMTVTGEMYLMQVFPSAGFEAVRRIELLTYALSVPLCLTVIRSLFEDEFHKRVIQVIWFAGALCSLIIIATPYKFYINVMGAYDVLTVALCLYTIAMMARASMLKRKGALLMLAGTVLISIGVLNDILLKSGITNTIDMFSYFLFVFLV